MSHRRETPFDNIESAQQFVELLIQAINESKSDVDADIALAEGNGSGGSERALRLVSTNLAKLSQHMTASHRILNHLKKLRRLLLQEPQTEHIFQNRELNRWS